MSTSATQAKKAALLDLRKRLRKELEAIKTKRKEEAHTGPAALAGKGKE